MGAAKGNPGGTAQLFLAPHYDDVALSCGGTVAALADAGAQPVVVTIFGGEPASTDLTAFARWQHERWGTNATDTVATRIAEDQAAAAALGCRTAVLPFLDAIYRGESYLSDEALFGSVQASDAGLVAEVAATVEGVLGAAEQQESTIYVPLAIGNHVDHQIVYQVGQRLAGAGWRVLAYEDFPYAALGDAAEARLAQVASAIGPAVTKSIESTVARRLAAIAAYQSQLPVIFRFTTDWQATVLASTGAAPDGQGAVERFWTLLGQE